MSSWEGSGSKSWPAQPLSPSISLFMDPSSDFVFGCHTPSLSVNSFPTPLILDAICNSFSGLSYLWGTSQACPVAALLSVYPNGTSVKNKLGSIDLPSCCLHSVGLLQFCSRCLAVVLILYSTRPDHMHGSTSDVLCIRWSFKLQARYTIL